MDGLICQIRDDHVVMFARNKGLCPIPKSACDGELGDFLRKAPKIEKYIVCNERLDAFKDVEAVEGTVQFKVMGIAPVQADLPTHVWKKYTETVWSPWIDLVSDPNDLCVEVPGEPLELRVKFAPSNGRLFEVIGVRLWPESAYFVELDAAPWLREAAANTRPSMLVPQAGSLRYKPRLPVKRHAQVGFLIEKKKFNPRVNCKVDYAYNNELGAVRSQLIDAPIGSKVIFSVNDSRRGQIREHKNHTAAIMAAKVRIVARPVPEMTVIDDVLHIETVFPFCREQFVDEHGSPREGTSFYNIEFGECDVHSGHVATVMWIIEKYYEKLRAADPEKFEIEKNDAICIRVQMKMKRNPGGIHLSDNFASIFYVKLLKDVYFLLSGESLASF